MAPRVSWGASGDDIPKSLIVQSNPRKRSVRAPSLAPVPGCGRHSAPLTARPHTGEQMRRIVIGTLATLALATLPASAQTSRTHLGPRIGYNFDAEEITVGGQISFPIGRRLESYPSADIHLVDPGSMFGV